MFKVDWTRLSEKEQLETAQLILDDVDKGSRLLNENDSFPFPLFDRKELGLGKSLGVGSFCQVEEILAIRLLAEKTETSTTLESAAEMDVKENRDEISSSKDSGTEAKEKQTKPSSENVEDASNTREFMQQQCLRLNEVTSQDDARYAIKRIKRNLPRSEQVKGMIDLAIETKLLKVTSHPNIVKMRAFSSAPMLSTDFFVILDRLYGTLEDKIDIWIEDYKLYPRKCFLCGNGNSIIDDIWLEQTLVAYDLASAFTYLHSNNIIYRDIKPNNIGFDVRGDLKLFDFGLSRELRDIDKTEGGMYKLTGCTGSRRYMAPEVALCKTYNLSADVYSYAIALHEILSLQIPFETYDIKEHMNFVVKKNVRPKIPNHWPGYLKQLLKSAWSPDVSIRPNFKRIKSLINTDITFRAEEEELSSRSTHMKNKSMRSRHGLTSRKAIDSYRSRENTSDKRLSSMDRTDHSSRR